MSKNQKVIISKWSKNEVMNKGTVRIWWYFILNFGDIEIDY